MFRKIVTSIIDKLFPWYKEQAVEQYKRSKRLRFFMSLAVAQDVHNIKLCGVSEQQITAYHKDSVGLMRTSQQDTIDAMNLVAERAKDLPAFSEPFYADPSGGVKMEYPENDEDMVWPHFHGDDDSPEAEG